MKHVLLPEAKPMAIMLDEVFTRGLQWVTEGNIFSIATYPYTVFILLDGQPQLVGTSSWISCCHNDVNKNMLEFRRKLKGD